MCTNLLLSTKLSEGFYFHKALSVQQWAKPLQKAHENVQEQWQGASHLNPKYAEQPPWSSTRFTESFLCVSTRRIKRVCGYGKGCAAGLAPRSSAAGSLGPGCWALPIPVVPVSDGSGLENSPRACLAEPHLASAMSHLLYFLIAWFPATSPSPRLRYLPGF